MFHTTRRRCTTMHVGGSRVNIDINYANTYVVTLDEGLREQNAGGRGKPDSTDWGNRFSLHTKNAGVASLSPNPILDTVGSGRAGLSGNGR